MNKTVAIIKWMDCDGISDAIILELKVLGYHTVSFRFDEPLPGDVDFVFSFAPYGRFLQIPHQISKLPPGKRPILIHWNTENYPDLRIPWPITKTIANFRSMVGRMHDSDRKQFQILINQFPLKWLDKRMCRFRNVGDYHYAYRNGLLDVFADISQIFAQLQAKRGLPALFAPWGSVPGWYADLKLDRDIDVLWMGKRRSRRRSLLLDKISQKLADVGVAMYIADDVQNPFIFGDIRTHFLNRAKITLHLEAEWYDNAFPFRYNVAAANRSMVISEPILPHNPIYEVGKHYISAPVEQLAETILYYLKNEEQRHEIIENAFMLLTTELSLCHSIRLIMEAAEREPCFVRP